MKKLLNEYIYHKVIATPENIKTILAHFDKYESEWQKTGMWVDKCAPGYDGKYACEFLNIPLESELSLLVSDLTLKGLEEYRKEITPVTINSYEHFVGLRYDIGKGQAPHFDGGFPLNHRILSGVLYLNDDYEGGMLDFPELGERFKPKAGELFLFPSNFCFVHAALPVTMGKKYAISSWLFYKQVNQ